MSNCPFCNPDPEPNSEAPNSGDGKQPGGFLHRAWRGIQWLFPTALLVLTPKCPMCVVAYFALFAGISITASTGRWIQILMPVFALTSLAYLTFRLCRNWWRRKSVAA